MNTKRERPFERERQPLLPLNETYREENHRDWMREQRWPEQLPLIEPAQRKLFG